MNISKAAKGMGSAPKPTLEGDVLLLDPKNQIPISHSPIRRKLPQLLAGSSAVLDCGNGFRCGRFRAAAIREEGKRDCVEFRHQPRRLSWPAAPKLIPPSSPTPRSIP